MGQEGFSQRILQSPWECLSLTSLIKNMRKKIIAANWKMNMTVAETESYLENFRSHVETVNGV